MSTKNKIFKFYIEFSLTTTKIDTEHPYLIQSQWFDSQKEALQWYKKSFDFIDEDMILATLMTAEFDDDSYEIVSSQKL